MERYAGLEHVNVGRGEDLSIRELAETVRDIVYPAAQLAFDNAKPDGAPRKLLDVSRLYELGWRHKIEPRGIVSVYQWNLTHRHAARGVPTPA